MNTYRTFQPTGFDVKGLNAESRGIGDFLVLPCGQNRDSGQLEQSNFAVALEMLGGESDTVQVHRFGHWACGWFELLLVDPTDTAHVAIAEDIEASLADYPVLNDEDFSNREYEAAAKYWEQMSVRARVQWLERERDISVFAARRDELPQDIDIQRLAE